MLRYRKHLKYISVFLAVSMLYQLLFPLTAFALTGGPSQPEVEGFEPSSVTDMVDLFTGKFNYNIPLLDVDGYPINISYNSSVTMDQEASWVGLGWSLNPGVVQRDMRGLPDDFDGEPVFKQYNIKGDTAYGMTGSVGFKLASFPFNFGLGIGLFYDNYAGLGTTFGINAGVSAGIASKGGLTAGLGLNFNSQDGADVSPTIAIGQKEETDEGMTVDPFITVGACFNSRTGLKGLTTKLVDDKVSGWGFNHSFISFATPTYIPTVTMPTANYSFSLNATVGTAIWLTHPNFSITGYGSANFLEYNTVAYPGYGYLNSDTGRQDIFGLLDFNREKDLPFIPSIKNLPIPNFTYDLFSVSGQGTGGQYRAYRGDVGTLFDPISYSGSSSGSAGLEVGAASLFHAGVDNTQTFVATLTGQWNGDNAIANNIAFKSSDGASLYEPYYFKNVGEKTINDSAYYANIFDTTLLTVQLKKGGSTVVAQSAFNSYSPISGQYLASYGVNRPIYKAKREKRDQSFSFLNGREANSFGLDKEILSYPKDTNVYIGCSNSVKIKHHSRIGYDYQKHQMSEITIINPDGKRYIYGIPAYNTLQKEVTFSADRGKADLTDQLVAYSGYDNTILNSEGNDHYYDAEQIPAYAHSFLLTGVLSPDYVDLTGDGITDDDLGQAVKINYTEAESDYQWRVPYAKNIASYQEVFKADPGEDRGNYLYGVKQLWYVHSIESKTMVAQFYISKRNDAWGAAGENGGFSDTTSRPSWKLDSIALFSKADLLQHGVNALPVKVVHFVYDYYLCSKVDNFNRDSVAHYDSLSLPRGKLTLKKIYFTYQGNTEGKLNSYQFTYCNNDSIYNPNYNQKNYDRWGNYDDSTLTGLPVPGEFPYTVQKKNIADTLSRAWKLTSIVLPSGGQVDVSYESDDYAYVQNQRANEMFQVEGASLYLPDSPGISLYNYTGNPFVDILEANYYLRIKLPVPVTGRTDFYNKYLQGIDENGNKLYFKFLVNIDGRGHHDYVPGYADIASYGLLTSTEAWILLAPASGDGINPIARAAGQFVRLNIPKLAYPYSVNNHSGFKAFLYSLLGLASAIGELTTPYHNYARRHYYGQQFDPKHSWIRLDNPTYIKFGGGARVSSITISDNWSGMVANYPNASYGQTYSYTMLNSSNQTISSGVASYEPFIGGDENPLRQPLDYSQDDLLAPSNNLYTEKPLGESLYPAPVVGYRQVTVQNLQRSDIKRTATGYTVNTFYTAYDFPTINSWTPISDGEERDKSNAIASLLHLNMHDYMTVSQGFVIENNDMHGKPNEQATYDANNNEISSTHYYYKTDDNGTHLSNDVSVVQPSGQITTASVGKDIDMWEDMRQQYTIDESSTSTPDIDGFLAGLFPVPFSVVFNFLNSEQTQFRSAATVKYIYRSGILDRVVKMENGSTVTTKNLLFDGETGNVLLTETTNEYDAPVYNFTYPALWAYSGMAPAYNNIGATINVTLHKGKIKYPSGASNFFTPGDQVDCIVNGQSLGNPYWIIKPQDSLIVIDDTGRVIRQHPPTNMSAFSGNCTLKVIRSGYRNMGDVPIGTIVSMKLPEQGDSLKLPSSPKIIQASATLYSDEWKTNCDKVPRLHCIDSLPYFNTCYKDFMINLLNYHVFYFNADSGITENCFIDSCNGNPTIANFLPFGQNYHTPVYTVSALPGEDMASSYEMQVGKCTLNITSLNGKPLYLDSLHLNNNFTSGGGHNSITGCDTLYYNYQIFVADTLSLPPDTLRWGIPPPGGWNPFPLGGGDGGGGVGGGVGIGGGGTPDDARFRGGLSSLPPSSAYQVPVAVSCWVCSKCDTVCEDLVTNNVTNPYAVGLKGNWRPYKGYVYYGDRTATASASASVNTNIFRDGVFKTFNPIWKYSNAASSFVVDTSDANWVWDNSVTQYNEKGSEVENKDALGIYSSSLFGYINSLTTATASDAKYKDIAFDNFEDYGFVNSCKNPCIGSHWNFINSLSSGVDTTSKYAHSGKYSLCIMPNHSASVTRSIDYSPDSLFNATDTSYVLQNGGCIYQFSPDSGTYVLDAWVKEGASCPVYGYSKDSIKIAFSGSAKTYKFMPSGPIISGWQRYQSKFNISASATDITVTLKTASSDTAYFDDIRIHPYESVMTAYVYDPVTLRLMAELDQNNYTTFYQYDDEGTLIRVNKETERGILTLRENRSTYHRK